MRKPGIMKSIAARMRGETTFSIWDSFKQWRVQPGDRTPVAMRPA